MTQNQGNQAIEHLVKPCLVSNFIVKLMLSKWVRIYRPIQSTMGSSRVGLKKCNFITQAIFNQTHLELSSLS